MMKFRDIKRYKIYGWVKEKKILLRVIGIIMIGAAISTGCRKSINNNTDITKAPVNTAVADTSDNQAAPDGNISPTPLDTEETLTIQDFYPFRENTVYRYEGEGNEYASYNTYTDYMNGNQIQLRKNNGGSETVQVLEIKDGQLVKVLSRGECYYREDLTKHSSGDGEVLLKEPLTAGTEWTLSDNGKRYISGVDVGIRTPSGSYKALEVTTKKNGETTVDYYVRDLGLVQSIYTASGTVITSSLSKIEENNPFKQTVRFFYPDADKEVIYAMEKEISFRTNDKTRSKLEEAIKEITDKEYDPLISVNTRINSLYLSNDTVVNADFSKELMSEMNAGAAYESLILQCITNTLGTYYGTGKVYITIEGKPYKSGHITMKKGETMDVKLDKVKELH